MWYVPLHIIIDGDGGGPLGVELGDRADTSGLKHQRRGKKGYTLSYLATTWVRMQANTLTDDSPATVCIYRIRGGGGTHTEI